MENKIKNLPAFMIEMFAELGAEVGELRYYRKALMKENALLKQKCATLEMLKSRDVELNPVQNTGEPGLFNIIVYSYLSIGGEDGKRNI